MAAFADPDGTAGPIDDSSRSRSRSRAIRLGIALAVAVVAGALGAEAAIHETRLHASEQGSAISNFIRERWGNERATRVEDLLFFYDAQFVRVQYWLESLTPGGGRSAVLVAREHSQSRIASDPIGAPLRAAEADPAALVLPEIKPLHADLQPDEGYWTPEQLPNPSPSDVLMEQARIHPDPALPKSTVHVLLLNARRLRLHITGGTKSPGADLGVVGPGAIPKEDVASLIAAWNGGFQGTHAPDYGMFADGQEYRRLNNGLASIVVFKNGDVRMGQWGRDFAERTSDMVAIRQNSMLIVDNGEISPRIDESVMFGLVNIGDTQHFVTWRSAIGVTENGDLLVATGDYINQVSMARSMWAAGAKYAMLLDNNLPYVQTVLCTHLPDGSLRATNTRNFMSASPNRYLAGNYAYDFMYATVVPKSEITGPRDR